MLKPGLSKSHKILDYKTLIAWINSIEYFKTTDCKLPPLPEYASVNCSSNGLTCEFNCMPGTTLIGQLILKCNQNTSKWNFPPPSCKGESFLS